MDSHQEGLLSMRPVELAELGDAPLVTAIGRFSEEALAEAYRRHSGAVHGLARRILRDETLAEEITQEVFLRLWNNPEKFDAGRGSLRSFLLAHTHGRSIDLIRAESARRTREDNDARLAPEQGQNIEEDVWEMALADTIKNALSTLGESERRPIELAYFGGHTYREVAEMIGQPEGTVKSRIRSGLKKLKMNLGAVGLETP
jgi:RNA polymerase sigma-70 factor (ECF subfamily)